jgi:ATP-binding cassette subfamily C protein
MLQVYDRVLPSRSVPTLVGLGLLALMLFCLFGVMDALRARILTRIARAWHEQIGHRVFDALLQSALRTGNMANGIQPLRDLETLRAFMSGVALTALFDLPWMPLYVGICFMFHPWIGVAVLAGALLLCLLTLLTEIMSRGPTARLVAVAGARQGIAETALRNAVVVHALGLRARMAQRRGGRVPRSAAAPRRRHQRLRQPVARVPHRLAVGRAGGRRLPSDPAGGDRRRDARRHHPFGACARSGRARDRQLA